MVKRAVVSFSFLVSLLTFGHTQHAAAVGACNDDTSNAVRYGPGCTVIGSIVGGLVGEDDDTEVVAIPWKLNFFGEPYDAICISTNGGIFPINYAAGEDGLNDDLPPNNCYFGWADSLTSLAANSQRSAIFALGTDQATWCTNETDPLLTSSIWYGETTVNGRDAIIVTFNRMEAYDDGDCPATDPMSMSPDNNWFTYQLVLIKGGGDDSNGYDFTIELNYGTIRMAVGGYQYFPLEPGFSNCNNVDLCWAVGTAQFTNPGATAYPLFDDEADLQSSRLIDSSLDTGLVYNSRNSAVPGRYVLNMIDGQAIDADVEAGGATPTHPSKRTYYLDPAGGSCDGNSAPWVITRRSGYPLPTAQDCTREGYVLLGWTRDPSLTAPENLLHSVIARSGRVTAVWGELPGSVDSLIALPDFLCRSCNTALLAWQTSDDSTTSFNINVDGESVNVAQFRIADWWISIIVGIESGQPHTFTVEGRNANGVGPAATTIN